MTGQTIGLLLVMIIYLILMVGIGVLYSKKNNDVSDFYLGGRKLGPIVTAMSAEASDMSSWLLMGLPGVAYLSGCAEAGWTAIGLAIGYQGGEVTLLFSIGASLGIVLGGILSISPVHCAALGYAAVFAGATNTLLAPVLIGLEVFGANDMVPFLIVCIFAYLVNGDKSIYGAQEVRK